MITMAKYLLFLLSLYCVSCGVPPEASAGGLIEKTIQAHGWNQKKPALISFDFRDHHYEIQRDPKGIAMQRAILEPKDSLVDRWLNYTHFSRSSQGKVVVVSDSMQNVYAQSINSVVYFMQLPLGLQDPAVLASHEGVTEIAGQSYEVLKVGFKEQGGGEDFQDSFYYWIHAKEYTIDYMAYSYHTNGGGTRFRVAKNAQNIKGFRFQDYDNYKPAKHPTPLDSMPYLWEAGQLKLLSRIENENLSVVL